MFAVELLTGPDAEAPFAVNVLAALGPLRLDDGPQCRMILINHHVGYAVGHLF